MKTTTHPAIFITKIASSFLLMLLFATRSVAQAPLNDLCANATPLTSGASCTPVAGTVNNATFTSGVPAGTCGAGTNRYDVWYQFTAQSPNPVITLSGIGAGFLNPRIQVLSGTCGSWVNAWCGLASTAPAANMNLVVGTSYFVRVYSIDNPIPTTTGDFSICITDPPAPLNDNCAAAVTLTSSAAPVAVTGNVGNSSYTAGTPLSTCGTPLYDVWYTFTAKTANPVIALANVGSLFNTPRIQVLAGTCATTLTHQYCNTAGTVATFPLSLIIGNVYTIRVYSTAGTNPTAANGGFDITVTDPAPPANDASINAITLTSNTATCTPTAGVIANATYDSLEGPTCGGTPKYDVWYKFTAQRVNPTISVIGYNNTYFNNPRIQILSGVPGSFTSVGCNTTPYVPTTLVPGQQYYIRVYSISGTYVPNASNGPNFSICISDPARPVNDDCATPTSITQQATGTCSNVGGNLANATPSATAIPGDCGSTTSPDLWYSFVATSLYPQINVTGANTSLAAAGLRVQLFSGVCGSLTSLVCNRPYGTGNSIATYPNDVPLIIGQTYLVRVYSNGTTPTNTLWNFNICITTPAAPTIHYGKTYTNITKGTNGGTIEPGDILEMRAIVNLRTNAMFNARFQDNIPANTTYVPGTLRILTNEGQIFRQWTDATDSDPAQIIGSAVTINLGNGANATSGSTVRSTDRPTLGGSIFVVSYRIQVSGAYGTTIQMGGGSVNYVLPDGTPIAINYNPAPAAVYQNYGICTNTIGKNGILSEFGGTFGSGTTKDRAASNQVPANYTYTPFTTGQPGDYSYGISNNTSANNGLNYSINPNDPVTANRVFGFWDILGDHTGASDPLLGNLPADVNSGATGGYMVVINASYRADTAFQDTVRNLCPNTSYEYSAWFRNVCRRCGVDSTGVGYTNPAYVQTGPGDTSGVHPNLTFNINGSDYYTTGDILYTNQWIKKGFTYRTGASETQMVINIRNNAPGGGGNDWAIDDIGVATCSPTLVMNPATPTVNVCYGDGQSLSANVVSYYDNFTHWIWEKSVDSGTTWATSGFSGNSTANFNGAEYEYTATGPSFIGDSTTHKNMFRLRVASTTANLADTNCSFRAIRTIQVMVQNCMYVLKTKVLSVNGVLDNSYGIIDWKTTNEETGVTYTIEKSIDGTHFTAISAVPGKALKGFGEHYRFADPAQLKVPTYYRIGVKENNNTVYTKVILLSPVAIGFDVKNVVNPFDSQLSFDVITPAEGSVKISVLDNFGRVVRTFTQPVYKGVTAIKLNEHGALANGVYGLKVEYGNASVIKRMVKINQ